MKKLLSHPAVSGRPNLSDDITLIVDSIKEEIFIGKLKPRERLIELSLCQKYKAKRSQVRKALSELERYGFIVIEPNKGATVRDFSIEEVEQIIQMRHLLEEQAARLIPFPVSADLLSFLKNLQKLHKEAMANGNPRYTYRLNRKFHATLYSSCGNEYLTELIRYFATLIDVVRSYRMIDSKLNKRAPLTHKRIIAALENEDREELVRLCLDHIKPGKVYYVEMHEWWAKNEKMSKIAS